MVRDGGLSAFMGACHASDTPRVTLDRPSLRENALAVRSLTPAMAARAQAYLFIAAGAVGSLGVLLPHPERYDAAGLLAIQCAALAAAALLLVLGARTPDWVATCGPFGATVL